MTKGQKRDLTRILIGAALYFLVIILPIPAFLPVNFTGIWKLMLFMIPYIIIGGGVVIKALRNITHGQIFDENFLMCIATIGAFLIGEYSEAVAVMLFYQVGELFQSYAVNRSRQSITELMDIRPDYANMEEGGKLIQVDPDDIKVDDIIIVKAGERIPLDGKVISGISMVDTSALTGESVPRKVDEGSDVISGCINTNGLLKIKVTKVFGESTVSRILDMVENASNKKAKAENYITKFARYYTPVVVIFAVFLCIIPPLMFGQSWSVWVERALIFLMISCPCALVISIPLSFFGGIGGASKLGVLVKGSNYLEALAEVRTIVFDKTGTLTKGTFKVTAINPVGISREQLLEMAALAESYSDHPISLSLKESYEKEVDMDRIEDAEEIPGHGVKAKVDGHVILAGNKKLMDKEQIAMEECSSIGTLVYVAVDGAFVGSIVISDEIKEEAVKAIHDLKSVGITKTVMLTGDRKEVGEQVALALGIDLVYSELLPGDKVDRIEELLKQKGPKEQIAFVGDGINDAPVLSRVDVGIAMGGLGSAAAIEAADIVLMDDNPAKIATAVKIANKTLRIVKQNIIFALGIKLFILVLGAIGIATMWEAVFSDVVVSVIAILNAMRALSIKKQ